MALFNFKKEKAEPKTKVAKFKKLAVAGGPKVELSDAAILYGSVLVKPRVTEKAAMMAKRCSLMLLRLCHSVSARLSSMPKTSSPSVPSNRQTSRLLANDKLEIFSNSSILFCFSGKSKIVAQKSEFIF